MRGARGFSLVELVTVMSILAILSIGTVYYIRDASAGVVRSAERGELADTARFAVTRIAAEARDALPTSVRSNGACLELIPIRAGTNYLNLPTASQRPFVRGVPVVPAQPLDGTRGAVPTGANPYDLALPAPLSSPVTVTGPSPSNEITVTFAASHQFPAESQTDRFYFVEPPVSICVDGTDLWRYEGYGFSVAQPGLAALPAGLPGRALLAEHVVAGATPFTVLPPTLQRNAMVEVVLRFRQGATSLDVETRVQVRNVP